MSRTGAFAAKILRGAKGKARTHDPANDSASSSSSSLGNGTENADNRVPSAEKPGAAQEEDEIRTFLEHYRIPTSGLFRYAATNAVSVVEALRAACDALGAGAASDADNDDVDMDSPNGIITQNAQKVSPEKEEAKEEDWDASFALLVQLAESEGGMEYQFKALADLGVLDGGGEETFPRECSVCFEYHPLREMLQLPCEQHHLCASRECLEASIFHAIKSRTVFVCCKKPLTPELLTNTPLPAEFITSYALLHEELNTPSPLFCPLPDCASFIPRASITSPHSAQCPKCGSNACPTCKASITKPHTPEDCKQYQEGEKKRKEAEEDADFVKVAQKENWKMCPKEGCGRWVEKISGCNFVVCKCGGQICFKCGGVWKGPAEQHGSQSCGNPGCVGVW